MTEIYNEICFLSFLHKAKIWGYEHEARIFCPLSSGTKRSFDPDELVGLTVGPNASGDLEQHLRTLTTNFFPAAKVERTNLSATEFRISMPTELP